MTGSLWSLSFPGTWRGGVLHSALDGKSGGGDGLSPDATDQPTRCVHRHSGMGEGDKRGKRNGLLWQQFTAHSGMREGVLTREIDPLWGIKIRFLI